MERAVRSQLWRFGEAVPPGGCGDRGDRPRLRFGTIKDVVDQRRDEGEKIGVLGIVAFRPFPTEAIREALKGAKRVIVVEKAFSVGIGGIVGPHTRPALPARDVPFYEVIAGLGGRPITKRSLNKMLDQAVTDTLAALTFLDLDEELVEKELEREAASRQSGPAAENLVRLSRERTDAALGR